MQERFWATVAQVYDHSHVHPRIDVDVLQPIFRGLHFWKQTVDEMGRRKRRRTMMENRDEAQENEKEQKSYDEFAQKWNCVEWEQEEVLKWRKELKTRKTTVAAREATVFQRQLEYSQMERCPLCGKKGGGEAQHYENQGRNETVVNKTAAGVRAANKAVTNGRQEATNTFTRAGQLFQRALGRGNEEGPMRDVDGRTKTWEETCATQNMIPHRFPFLWDNVGASVEIHGCLPRRRTPRPRIVTTGERRQWYPGIKKERALRPKEVRELYWLERIGRAGRGARRTEEWWEMWMTQCQCGGKPA